MLVPRGLVRPASALWLLAFVVFFYIIFSTLPVSQNGQYHGIAGLWHGSSDSSLEDVGMDPPSAEATEHGSNSQLAAETTEAPSTTSESISPAAPSTQTASETSQVEPSRPTLGDKVIVMGRLQNETTDWVQELLPDWQNAIYTVDNTSAPLHTPQNKGREANPYLLYIIQHYYELPSTLAFLHAHRDGYPGGWHTDAAGYDNVVAMNTLSLDFVQQNGYVNLRCNWTPGCPDEVQYLRNPEDLDPDNVEHGIAIAWRYFFGNTSVPEVIATPCCAQFAVSREQVHARPLDEYKLYHQWLMDTPMSDDSSGRIFEYLWHVIFGKDAVYCPDMATCYRDVYGGRSF